jgi:phosphatidylglycerophosphate synthase
MQCTVLVSLYVKKLIPLWFVIPFFAKELFTLLIGFIVLKKRSVVVVSKWYGKMTVCLFYATIVLSVIIADTLKENPILMLIVFLPAIICAFLTLGAYIKHYAGLRKKDALQTKSKEKADTADAAENG